MSDGDLKSQWQRLPTAAKLICGGAAALVGLAMIGALAGDDADYADAEGAPAGYAAQPGYYGGGQGQAQGYAGGGYAGGGNAGGGYAGGAGVNSDAQMAAWEAQQRAQDQGVVQFNQMIREEDTIRDNVTLGAEPVPQLLELAP